MFFSLWHQKDRVYHGVEGKVVSMEMVTRAGSWLVMVSSTHRKQREERKWGQVPEPQRPPTHPVMFFL